VFLPVVLGSHYWEDHDMAGKRARFEYAVIVDRIRKAIERDGRPAKQVYEAAGIPTDRWYRKMRGDASTFTLDEFGRIADALDAPEGWPFVEWGAR
jgi:hypothetical protein